VRAPRVLVVAGHDPSFSPTARGGAGVDADREAIEAFGGEARCVVTAWTDQAQGVVRSLGARDPGAWLREARAELSGPAFGALKSGLLPGAGHVRALARLLDELPPGLPAVVDPVLAASGGEPFLAADGVAALLAELLPRGVVLTPNVPEAARLAGLAPGSTERLAGDRAAREAAAGALLEAGARAVVLKGGHGREDPVRDLVWERGAEPVWLAHPRIPGLGLHGSGCRFASALAAGLAGGLPLVAAARRAGEWVAARIAAARPA
jgi:hydroxymethylpyrimidine/phosphomethylpyrimidine kinase